MSFLVENEILMFVSFSVAIFFVSYRWAPSVLHFLHKRTLASQKETLQYIENMRIQRDKKITIIWLWVASLSIGALAFLISLPNILVGLIIGILLFLGTWQMVSYLMKSLWLQYCDILNGQMVEGMTLMANGMKVGLSVTQTMERVIKGVKGPLAGEFTLVLNKIKLGMSLEEALNEMSERVNLQDVTMLTTSVNILKETGGNLAETFATIATTIQSRQKVQSKIRALTAQGMMQARMVSAVPVVLLVIFYFTNKSAVILLFTTTLGLVSLAGIGILVFIGGKMMKKMATIDV